MTSRTRSRRRVAVTGMGIVSAIGCDQESVWSSLMAGETGIRKIQSFDASENKVQIGAEIDDEELMPLLKARKVRKKDRMVAMGLEAAGQALEQAALVRDEPPYDPQEIAVFMGSAVGPAETLHQGHQRFVAKGPKGMRPTSVPNFMANSLSSSISLHYRLTGTNQVIVSACTSAVNAIGLAFRQVADGYVDGAICGGSDAGFDPFYFSAWNNLGVFSKIEDPKRAYRPFDRARAGCLLGEGAGVLALEEWERAEARGATILGEVVGYGETSDALHVTSPDQAGQVRAIRAALDEAGISPEEIGYVNAHGTATEANDACESQSIREVFGPHADVARVGSSKSYFGHLLGASGAVETVVTLQALQKGIVPSNLNLDDPDPECNVRLVGGTPEECETEYAMKNSFGFGGGNGVLILRRPPV